MADSSWEDTEEEALNRECHGAALAETGFWGRQGAGCLFLARSTGRLLVAHRSWGVLEPDTWGTWGGAIDGTETPSAAAQREATQECGYEGQVELVPLVVFSHPTGFRYHNFLAIVDEEFEPTLNWESQGYAWAELQGIESQIGQMHPGLVYLLEHSGAEIASLAAECRRQHSPQLRG